MNLFLYVDGNPVLSIDSMGLDTWSGGIDEVDTFVLFGGKSSLTGRITNWQTGESCHLRVKCYKLGVGEIISGSANVIVVLNGPKCGKDLSGRSVGMGLDILSPSGTVGVDKKGSVAMTFGGSVGPPSGAIAMFIISCWSMLSFLEKQGYKKVPLYRANPSLFLNYLELTKKKNGKYGTWFFMAIFFLVVGVVSMLIS